MTVWRRCLKLIPPREKELNMINSMKKLLYVCVGGKAILFTSVSALASLSRTSVAISRNAVVSWSNGKSQMMIACDWTRCRRHHRGYFQENRSETHPLHYFLAFGSRLYDYHSPTSFLSSAFASFSNNMIPSSSMERLQVLGVLHKLLNQLWILAQAVQPAHA